MVDRDSLQALNERLLKIRTDILIKYPFFGGLLMGMTIAFGRCGTACTDMERIIFDPDFISPLSDEEIIFIMLHEVMHCALCHCTRGQNLRHDIYNLACDIVVNSHILAEMGVKSFSLAGEKVIHMGPGRREGRNYTAEEIYDVLIKNSTEGQLEKALSRCMDSHVIWSEIGHGGLHETEMAQRVAMTQESYGSPLCEPLQNAIRKARLDQKGGQVPWEEVLADFICQDFHSYDYSFRSPDRRFAHMGIIMPSLCAAEEESIDDIWFLIDASGSVSQWAMKALLAEAASALETFRHLKGRLSFFSGFVTKPIPVSGDELPSDLEIQTDYRTSFSEIFRYMKKNMAEKLPSAMVILTDGYAKFPPEEAAMGVPVLWVLTSEEVEPPWGRNLYIDLT